MRLLRMTEGYENRNKVVRYFSVPRTYERLFKILDSYRFKTGEIILGGFNNRPELKIRDYVPIKYKDVPVVDLTILDLRGSDTTFEVESFSKVPFSELTDLNLKGSTDTSRFQLDYFITENSLN